MTSKCLKLKWNGEWFYGKVWSIFNVISLKCRSLGSEKWLLVYLFFFTMSWRIVLKRQRRAEPFVSILCTVISKSKSSRPIGTRKSLGYCKSLDCVAAVLRGIGKSEKGRGKGKRKRGQLFFISAPFPFTSLPLFSRFCTCHANCHAGYCEIYIFTLA